MKRFLISMILIWVTITVYSQVMTYYNPKDVKLIVETKKVDVSVKRMPPVDVEKLHKEDLEMRGEDVPFRFGYGFDTFFYFDDGIWEELDNGRLWTIIIESENALSLNFVFDNLYLPDGAYLNIYNQDKSIIYGPVTNKVIPHDGFFLTDIIPGSKVFIQLFEPIDQRGKSTLTIKKVVHGYREYVVNDSLGNIATSANCNVPVEDYPEYQKESNAVGLVLLEGGTAICSGSLIMTTDAVLKPYFLTAFHCINIINQNDTILSVAEKEAVNHWAIKFGYKEQSNYSVTFMGAEFLSGWYYSDFSLVKMLEDPTHFPSLSWLGWDRSGNTPSLGVGIHHPKGDYMKISIDNDAIPSSTWFYSSPNNHWTTHWEEGITQGGSSGSPLLDQNRRIVGQVHGKVYENGHNINTYPCDMNYTSYGKFSASWDGGGADSCRLKNWLDSIGSNPMYVDGSGDIKIFGCNVVRDSVIYSLKYIPSGCNIQWSLVDNNNLFVMDSDNPYQCKLKRISNSTGSATLKARIYYNGQLFKQVTKTIYIKGALSGTYKQEACTFHGVDHPQISIRNIIYNTAHFVHQGCMVEVYINNGGFNGLNVSMDNPVDYFQYSDGYKVKFILPYLSGGVPFHIIARDDENNIVYQILFFSITGNGNVASSHVTVTTSDEYLLVDINEDEVSSSETKDSQGKSEKDNEWITEIYSMTTGRKVFSEKIQNSPTLKISTSGWKKDTYIIRVLKQDVLFNTKIILGNNHRLNIIPLQ